KTISKRDWSSDVCSSDLGRLARSKATSSARRNVHDGRSSRSNQQASFKMEVIFTDRFLDRVEEFSDYIALDNIPEAVTWADDIFSNCQKLQTNPNIGRMVPEFRRPEIRELIHGNYRLTHEVKESQVDMLTVWNRSQQLPDKPEDL